MKKITLKTLATSIDELALMVANGFDDIKTNLGGDISVLKTDVAVIKTDVSELKNDMSDVKLRLDNLAPKFEVRDLEKRVTKLEIKTGIRRNT